MEVETVCVIELVGSPKEHVEEVMKKIVDKVKESYKLADSKTFDAKQMDKLWAIFSELTIKFNKIEDLFGFCFDYMPSSVEIINPNKFIVNNTDINTLLNDLVGRLHEYDMMMKNLKAVNSVMKKQIEGK